jgi:hypothetical protein
MSYFRNLRPRQPISVRELKEAGRQIGQTFPLGNKGSNRGIRQLAGGTQIGDLTDEQEHLGIITAKITGSPGSPIKYGITERWMITSSGALEDVPQPIKFDGTVNYALAIGGVEYNVNDIVTFSRSKRDPDLFEIKKGGGGAAITPNCDNANFGYYTYDCASGSLIGTPVSKNIEICIDTDGTLSLTIT